MANALIQNPVDRENHIVHGVKVLGFTSANGRIYDFAAVKEAIQKYEKAPVNKDHNMEEPSFSDRLGWLENVTLEKDGLYADFHYNPHADGIESFLWFAEHNGLGDVGFSHLVSGKYSVDPDGTERITRIDKVKSVDLVANPATTKTIFESEKLDQGNNETLSRGIEKNNDGTYTALTYSNSKTFKTLAGAKKWMNERPRPMKEAENVYLDFNKFKDQHLKMYPKASETDCKKAFEKYKSIHAEQEDKQMGKKIASENSYEDDYYPGENPDDHEVMMKNQKLLMQQRAAKKREEELKKSKGKKIAKEVEKELIKQGDSEMDNKKMMEEENPMQQQEGEENPMEEAEDIYAKVKEVCEGEGSDDEKAKQVLEMLGLSGGMSEGEEPMEEAEEDPKEKDGSESAVLEVDDEEDEEEEPKKESKSELASLRKWKAEKLKEEKIVNLIKESNLEPTKVFIKQLSAIDSKLWSEAIRDRKKVALVKSSVKPISSGLQSRSESSYKQFLESVLGK